MDILLGLLGNDIVTTVGASLFGLFVGGVGVWVYVQSGISKMVKAGGDPVGNWLGRLAYNNILKPIKDDNLRNKLATDLNLAGNDFDKGWDRGLKGLK